MFSNLSTTIIIILERFNLLSANALDLAVSKNLLYGRVNSLPNNKILDRSKLEALAE